MLNKYLIRIERNAKRAIAMEYIRRDRILRKRLRWV
jgi:hypothetical protein